MPCGTGTVKASQCPVSISIEEKALAPNFLLRVPYLERILEAVRDGTLLDCRLLDAVRPAVIQAHDDLATYITEIVLAMFDGDYWSARSPAALLGPCGPADGAPCCPLTNEIRGRCRIQSSKQGILLAGFSACVTSMQRACTHTKAPHCLSLCAAAATCLRILACGSAGPL